jgi:hypothetical protein
MPVKASRSVGHCLLELVPPARGQRLIGVQRLTGVISMKFRHAAGLWVTFGCLLFAPRCGYYPYPPCY